MQQMLASCEKYSLKKHEWSSICRLNSPKCAFGTASWENKFIYVFGGFNGMIRLNEIERYNIKENRWSILDVKLKYNLSNTSAIYTENDQILILGGGCDMGYVLDLFEYDCKTECIKSL